MSNRKYHWILWSPQSLLKYGQNTLLWSYFNVSPIPGKLWYPRRGKKGPGLCSWKTTDSARASSTTNMRSHLNKHRLESSTDNNGHEDTNTR
ncbi:hypothetical protein V1505DRAFT_318236 [Lipomyces doorenjongii]